jgi:ParB/RepB/Spo0J family partition protein
MKKTKTAAPDLHGEPMTIAVGMLDPNPHNKRHWRDNDANDPELCALRDSIERTGGNIQRVLVRAKGDGYEILAGERRFRAIRMSKALRTVNCEVYTLTDDQAFEFCMAENARRKNLEPLEEADTAASWMQARPGWTLDDLAAHMGISRATAARRLQLASLSPDWRAASENPNHFAYHWGAGNFERIAALPLETQNALLDVLLKQGGETSHWLREFSMSRLDGTIGQLTRTLDKVPWALDAAPNPCTACPKRSSCQPELWDDADLEADPDYGADDDEWDEDDEWDGGHEAETVRAARADTCLDGACFDAKLAVVQQEKLEAVRAKHPGVVAVLEWNGKPEDWMGTTAKRNDMEVCKRSAPGAVPTIRLADLDGGVKWMLPCSINGKADTKAAEKQSMTPEQQLKEKRVRLEMIRWKFACASIQSDLTGMIAKPKTLPMLDDSRVLALAHIGGTNHNHGASVYGNDGFWKELDKAAGLDTDNMQGLYVLAVKVICSRLHTLCSLTEANFKGEASGVCAFFQLDREHYWDEACAAKPEPKSWAKTAIATEK